MKHHCDFKIIKDTPEVQIEVCTECKRKLKTTKGTKERINNKKYLEEHSRDFAQIRGKSENVFKRYYGKPTEFKRTKTQEEYESE